MPQDHVISILFEDGLPNTSGKKDRIWSKAEEGEQMFSGSTATVFMFPTRALQFSLFGHHRLSRSRPFCDARSESLNFHRKLLLCDNRIPSLLLAGTLRREFAIRPLDFGGSGQISP